MLSLDRYTNNQIISISYWKSREHLARFAQAPPHMKGWMWWNKTVKEHDHLSIMHEVYDVPAGNWENIYVNSHKMCMGEHSPMLIFRLHSYPTYQKRMIVAD